MEIMIVPPQYNTGWLVYTRVIPSGHHTLKSMFDIHKQVFSESHPIKQERFQDDKGDWLMIELYSGATREQLGAYLFALARP
jgi:hypothetical protein